VVEHADHYGHERHGARTGEDTDDDVAGIAPAPSTDDHGCEAIAMAGEA
jgi:hypothetical protein